MRVVEDELPVPSRIHNRRHSTVMVVEDEWPVLNRIHNSRHPTVMVLEDGSMVRYHHAVVAGCSYLVPLARLMVVRRWILAMNQLV
jgi:hypothetical protein